MKKRKKSAKKTRNRRESSVKSMTVAKLVHNTRSATTNLRDI
jgi:hypothetical protein